MSCKCRLHVETRWSPTRTWHAVLRRSSKDTTIAIVPSFPDTPRAFTASFNVIPRFFKPGRCGLWFFEFSDVEQRFVGSCAAHVRLEPRWQCLKPPSRCELGCMWHKVQLGCKRGAVLSRTSWSRTDISQKNFHQVCTVSDRCEENLSRFRCVITMWINHALNSLKISA